VLALPANVTSWEWEQARSRCLEWAVACRICGKALRPDAPPRSRWSSSVDHIIPRAVFMDERRFDLQTQRFLCLDPSNLQAVHAKCNGRKGKRRQRQVAPLIRSQEW